MYLNSHTNLKFNTKKLKKQPRRIISSAKSAAEINEKEKQ